MSGFARRNRLTGARALHVAAAVVLLGAVALLRGDGAGAAPSYRLADGMPDDIYAEIRKVQERRDATAAEALLDAVVGYTDPHLAVAAGEALKAMDPAALEAGLFKSGTFGKYERSIKKLKEPIQQISVAHALGAWGHPEVDGALAFLCSNRREPPVQASALFMAGALVRTKEAPFREVKEAIADALNSKRGDDVLCAAASAAGRWKEPSFAEALQSTIRSSRGKYPGLYAVWAMRQIGLEPGITSFVHVLNSSPKRETMQANLKAITELSGLRDIDDLLSLSRSPRKDLRDAAVLALGRMPWKSRRGRMPGQEPVRKAEVTGEKPPDDLAPVEKLPDPGLDIPDKVIERMIQIVGEDREWEVRDAARQGLMRFGVRAQAQVQAAMPALVKSNTPDISYTAIELCGLFDAERAYKDVFDIALHEQRDRALRMFAFRALEGIDPERAVLDYGEQIRPRGKAKDSELNAVRGLGYLRVRSAFDLLIEIVSSAQPYSEDILREAEFALERLTGHRFGRVASVWNEWIALRSTPFRPRIKGFDRAANRREAIDKGLYGVTQSTERAVEAGLLWLARQQHVVGSWDGNEKGFGGSIHCEPAYTGLAALSLLGAGYQGHDGKYHQTIRRATEFLGATQFYDGGYPVTGGGDDSWIYAYMIGMAVWGVNEAYGLSADPALAEPAQWGIDYLVRVQTPGAGWRYGPRYTNSDTSCTSWVLMATKMADLIGIEVAQKSWDGIDDWLERASFDITGEIEKPEDTSSDYEHEVGIKREFEAFTSYFELTGSDSRGAQKISMTAVGMVCRFFMGWKRSHPFQIGSANFLVKFLPQWMAGMNKDQNVAWYHYYWYYGTLSMHQMGGKYWRAWNQSIKKMYPEQQRKTPPELAGSWDPDPTLLNGGRIFSTAMSILSLESYYRFSPLLGEGDEPLNQDAGAPKAPPDGE